MDGNVVSLVEAALHARGGRRVGAELLFRCPKTEHHANGDQHPSARWNSAKATWFCDVGKTGGGALDLARELGIQIPKPSNGNGNVRRLEPRVVATYDYGSYLIDRVEPGRDGRRKEFRVRLPDGRNGLNGEIPHLYRLNEALERVSGSRTLVVVEGEGKVDALMERGIPATSNPFGAGKWTDAFSSSIPEAFETVILPDRDKPGQEHGRKVTESLRKAGRKVRIATLPGDGNDVVDYLAAGGTVQDLEKSIRDATTTGTAPRLVLVTMEDLMRRELPPRRHLFEWDGAPRIHRDALYLGDGLTRAGKGMLQGAALPVALATGGGWGRFRGAEPARALIVTVEDTERRLKFRLEAFLRGMNLDISALGGRLCVIARPRGGLNLGDAAHVGELLEVIEPFRPDYLYLDNLARLSDRDENTSEIRPAMDGADQIREVTGAATILCHHWGKDNEGRRGVHKSRGWSGIPGYAEAHLTVTRPEGSETATLGFHDGKDDEDWSLDFTLVKLDLGSWLYEVTPAAKTPGSSPDAPRARVLAAASSIHSDKREGVTATGISAKTGLSERTVSDHLRALVELGAIRVDGKARNTRYYPASNLEQDPAGESIAPPRDSRGNLDGVL